MLSAYAGWSRYYNIYKWTYPIAQVNYDTIIITHRIALQLPLLSILQVNDDFNLNDIILTRSTLNKITADNIYIFDPILKYIRPRFDADGQRSFPRISKKNVTAILNNQLQPHFFFARLCVEPFFPTSSHTGGIDNHNASTLLQACTLFSFSPPVTTKQYRQHFIQLNIQPSRHINHISSSQWNKFWALSMFSSSRNAWFRAIHGKLPTAQRLHELVPDFRPSNLCQLCLTLVDTPEHFLVKCPARWSV
ncbi:hypothetical protein INT45_010956 [Circinella minor]|uniref:Reverse transcriptase zinc-binding domain-containing protein n=1 Tax=Circinella minor TaxID=1195481 RepID=A0A8H7RPW8_9FUNG|nr:hypothetical protein INT45_010956 [Circinella minor]